MDKNSLGDSARKGVRAVEMGKQVVRAVKNELPATSAAVKTKAMKLNQEFIRPHTEPAARQVLEKGVRPLLDKLQKTKSAAVNWLESPDRKYIKDYKQDRLKVHFKEAARQPLTLKRTVAVPVNNPPGPKRAQAVQLLAAAKAPRVPVVAKTKTKSK